MGDTVKEYVKYQIQITKNKKNKDKNRLNMQLSS